MPWQILKRLFKNVTEAELKKTIKRYIKLKIYNKTLITQLGTCMVTIDFKDNKKRCEFFVVPRNGQALLGMPDTAALQIINLNIDSIQAMKEECNTNIHGDIESNANQEAHGVEMSCRNMEADLKVDNNANGHYNSNNVNTLTNYFLSSPNVEADKGKSIELI